ncbi:MULTISPECIES: protein kinase [unclassified Adlercreutzia]|uniref:protein kinase domain-containing protein n=1 Tax=unclassified Adlercreutzia TaxID=2636013 RepID=UPI0013EA7735|nr:MULTISPECIES: protein kinase [unclassified Adlercreutzia]
MLPSEGLPAASSTEGGAVAGEASLAGARLMRVEGFEAAVALAAGERDDYARRFSILLVDEGSTRRGGIGEVSRAMSARGERVAVKRLRLGDAQADEGLAAALVAAFQAEYETHRHLSGLRGFPRLFGRGSCEGDPVVVMEWIEGVTLEEAARALAVDEEGRLSPLTAARIGRDLFDLLVCMGCLDASVVHRDVSLRNVMVDTSRLSLADQVEEGSFELRLIDFGSAVASCGESPSITSRFGSRRHATADFASPEMLTDDIASVERLRQSAAVDVYAAASVLYALLEGHPPYDLGIASRCQRVGGSAYRLKTEFAPAPPAGAHASAADVVAVLSCEPEVAVAAGRGAADADVVPTASGLRLALSRVDDLLAEPVLACLRADQRERPTASEMQQMLADFCDGYAANVGRALRGEPLATHPLSERAERQAARKRTLRRLARVGVRAVCAAACVAVAVSAGVLSDGMSVAFPAGTPLWSGCLPGAVVATALLLPGVVGLAARWTDVSGSEGFARAAAGDVLAAAFLGVSLFVASWPSQDIPAYLALAFVPAASAPLCAFAVDRMVPAGSDRAKKPAGDSSRPTLPWGASEGVLTSLGLASAADAPAFELSAAQADDGPSAALLVTSDPGGAAAGQGVGEGDVAYECPEEVS